MQNLGLDRTAFIVLESQNDLFAWWLASLGENKIFTQKGSILITDYVAVKASFLRIASGH